MDANRDKLYAAAFARITFQEWTANLPYALAAKQASANEGARVGDELVEDKVSTYLDGLSEVRLERVVNDVADAIPGQRVTRRAIQQAMELAGWEARRRLPRRQERTCLASIDWPLGPLGPAFALKGAETESVSGVYGKEAASAGRWPQPSAYPRIETPGGTIADDLPPFKGR